FLFLTAALPSYSYTLSLHDALPICWHHAVVRDRGVDQRHLERRDEELALAVRRVRDERRLVERPRFRELAARGGKLDLWRGSDRSEEHTSELQSLRHLVCRLLLEKK